MAHVVGFLVVVLESLGLWSALPPWAVQAEKYEACVSQARAPEVVRVLVTGVQRRYTWCPSRRSRNGSPGYARRYWRYQTVTVSARVIAVKKTATHLRPGRRIRFEYSLFQLCPRMVGPSNRPQIQDVSKGDRVWVFLQKDGREYRPAAGALSIVSSLPRIKSLEQWKKVCEKRYPHRRP